MRVNIGPYTNWIGPYQIAEWFAPIIGQDRAYRFGDMLCNTWVNTLCNWIEGKKKRKIDVHIDGYDVWGADHTLALIITPLLKKLKVSKHGAPLVEDSDVPEGLRSTSAKPQTEDEKNVGEPDEFHFKRWDYVVDEMIWAFEHHATGDVDWSAQYASGEIDWKIDPTTNEILKGPNHTYKFDHEAMDKHQKRIDNGLRLFAKYYNSLWT